MSIASVKTMHMSMQMQHEQMMNQLGTTQHQQMMQAMTVQDMKAHCADMQMQLDDQHANTDLQKQNLTDCHKQLIQSKQVQHSECQDCALFSCQSSIVWFNSDIPQLSSPEHSLNLNSLESFYQVQHLAGHWQEILRPPKA
ncbi:hypothetical protein [uncultured Acinetobacter sp.]|uniref:hypothetical protein n=1 Tax=uncultured Acinetobacter sp. TaxID=165433 RepID=UPI0025E4C646|nr:hypothetical protein [uncultured Acinetobacter sp.]